MGVHPPSQQLFKINIKVKGPSPISISPPPMTKPYQRRRVGGRDRRQY